MRQIRIKIKQIIQSLVLEVHRMEGGPIKRGRIRYLGGIRTAIQIIETAHSMILNVVEVT